MNLFDLLAVLILIAAILAGIRTGALPQVGGIAGAIGGLLLVLALAPSLLDLTASLEPIPRALVVLGAVLAAVVIGEAVGSGLGRVLAGQLGRGVLSSMDRVAGGLLGAIQALLIVWLVGGLLASGPFPTLGRAATQSAVVRGVDQFLPPPTEVVGEIAGALDASGLPDVFVGLDPMPLPPVDTPTDPQAARIARAAMAGTARISTRACNSQVNGTGVIIAPGYVVTNAHVVAGATTIRVALDTGVVDAVPVLFDPNLDVAVLYAPHLVAGRSASRPRSRNAARRARHSGLRAVARWSSCRRPSPARTTRSGTTSTIERRSAAGSSSCARRSSPATRVGR